MSPLFEERLVIQIASMAKLTGNISVASDVPVTAWSATMSNA